MSPIPDLLLSDDALGDARVRLAEAAVPVVGSPGPGTAVFASDAVAAALAEVDPVLLHARTALAVVVAHMSLDLGMVVDTFAAVDVRLAGDVS